VHLRDFPEPAAALRDQDLEAGMEAVRRTVELGRAARARAKIKVRQPLRKAVVVASDSERGAISSHVEMVAGELNVKEVEFVAEQGELVSYRVKPNYRSLGPRFGKRMPQVAAAVAALDPDDVREATAGSLKLGIRVDGGEHALEPDDVTLLMQPLEGYEVESEAGRAVALALELDDDLRREGLAREIVHAVQNARRDAGLEVTDRIELGLDGDAELIDAARAHEAYVSGETLAVEVAYPGEDGEAIGNGATVSATIEGRELSISVSRAP
jgi:isoleucyl-tRNA synthetase